MINFPAKIIQRFKEHHDNQEEVNVKLLDVGGLRETTGYVGDVFSRNSNDYIKINDKTISAEEVVYIDDEYVYFAVQDKFRAFQELDFSYCSPMIAANGRNINSSDLSDPETLDPTSIIEDATNNWQDIAVGGYLERRRMYESSKIYHGTEIRNTHLGIDIWTDAGTPVHAPIDGVFYGICDNKGKGNYGPTIILKHNVQGCSFFTLYGHLSRNSLSNRTPGNIIRKGEELGTLGDEEENGNWPPHLHFQVILNMLGMYNDFPGVCAQQEAEFFANICPNPMTLVKWQ